MGSDGGLCLGTHPSRAGVHRSRTTRSWILRSVRLQGGLPDVARLIVVEPGQILR
jgi:hypothetical protein